MNQEWRLKSFEELTNKELYKILQLRMEVFVVEQQCIFQDADDKDLVAQHLCMWKNEILVAYCRILPPGVSYNEYSIGRVVNSIEKRKYGIGIALVKKAIEIIRTSSPDAPIRIGAQLYLKRFYESFGFKQDSDIYLEDGIEHIQMILK